MPAEMCGVAGMRPSRGRYPLGGVVPCNIKHDTPGPMAITVADLAVMDAAMVGEAAAVAPADLAGIGVAVPADLKGAAVPGHVRAIDLAVAAFQGAGATIKTEGVEWKQGHTEENHEKGIDYREVGLDDYVKAHPTIGKTTEDILAASEYPFIRPFYQSPINGKREPLVNMKNAGTAEEAAVLEEAFTAELAAHEAAFGKFFDDHGVDVIITPCTHGHPPRVSTEAEYKDGTATIKKHMMVVFGPSTPIMYGVSLQIPSLAMPTAARHDPPEGHEGAAMPAGVLLWGRPGGDAKLIQVALALEAAMK